MISSRSMQRRHLLQSAALLPLAQAGAATAGVPLRGLHLAAPKPDDMDMAQRFIEETLTKQGVNTLFLEFNYHFRNRRFPEIVDEPALTTDQVRALAAAARRNNIKLIPQLNLLGHQSWAKNTFALLLFAPSSTSRPASTPPTKASTAAATARATRRVHEVVLDRSSMISATSVKPPTSTPAWTRSSCSPNKPVRAVVKPASPTCSRPRSA